MRPALEKEGAPKTTLVGVVDVDSLTFTSKDAEMVLERNAKQISNLTKDVVTKQMRIEKLSLRCDIMCPVQVGWLTATRENGTIRENGSIREHVVCSL